MRHTTLLAGISVFSLTAGATHPAFAQSTRETTRETPGYYAGISAGETKFKDICVGGLSCDEKDVGLKLWAGAKLWGPIGLEAGYINMGKAKVGGSDTEAQGLNLSAVAALRIGQYSDLHAKLGATYGWTKAGGSKEQGWEPSGGLGTAIGINRNWQVVVDWDRFRFEFPGVKKDVDMLSAGLQFRY
jgi:hypothetical protein